ncbi:MAG: hypothetical protein DHS20C15_09000 [Planctomycetota bacterium]|nr:MAG: hypothetical protein DHS20C15_09000 [Planctomycetota bacterium]
MKQWILWGLWGSTMVLAGVLVWRSNAPAERPADVPATPAVSTPALAPSPEPFVRGPIKPIPLSMALDPAKVKLGERLFHDTQLSSDRSVSCASCHDLARGGADGRRVSLGVNGAEGELNAPSVLNSGFNFRQFWDGRAADLHSQVDGPITHPSELASSWEQVLARLSTDDTYVSAFETLYPEGLVADSVRDAIATFETSLITPNSRFDRFLRGETEALTNSERAGYQLFLDIGCVTCHQGVNIGGNMFQVFGQLGNYFEDRGVTTKADMGRFNITGREQDKHRFKVPSLRNVQLTAPYLHDGSVLELGEVVTVMARYELGAELEVDEVAQIVAFLHSLTGKLSIPEN